MKKIIPTFSQRLEHPESFLLTSSPANPETLSIVSKMHTAGNALFLIPTKIKFQELI